MQVAVFSDVHGNLTALDAVLDDIRQQAPDLTVFAGDLCVYGSRPRECVDRLRVDAIAGIYGNTDAWIYNDPLLSDDVDAEEVVRSLAADNSADWAWAQLQAYDRAWLRTLPFHRRISPTVFPGDDLFIVHANPENIEDQILPPEPMQRDLYGEVRQSDADLQPLMANIAHGTVAFGHVHVPFTRQWGDVTLVNVGSVSLPADGDTRAKYALFTWEESSGWEVDYRYVAYDLDEELALLANGQPPGWEILQRSLREARPFFRQLAAGQAGPRGA